MVEVEGETSTIWIMLVINLFFLIFRFHLRYRQKQFPKMSDYLIFCAFLVIVGEIVLITIMNAYEINFYHTHPEFPKDLDPIARPVIGYPIPKKMDYLKGLYALLLFNTFSLYTVKVTLIAFFYEVFPPHLRRALHLTALFVACAFLASLFSTIFWCFPNWRIWAPKSWDRSRPDGFCVIKIDRTYNKVVFGAHLASTVVVVILPALMLWRIRWTRKEVAFAVSTLLLGLLSVMASVITFIAVINMAKNPNDKYARHSAVLAAASDQNAIFWAGCLSVLRLRRRDSRTLTPAGEDGEQMKGGLVIRVERRWSVHVDIVEAWGQDWTDPWEELSNREEAQMGDEIRPTGP